MIKPNLLLNSHFSFLFLTFLFKPLDVSIQLLCNYDLSQILSVHMF